MKILIVDDEPVSREVLGKILGELKEHQVTAVENAAAAWALLDDPARYFDVVFLDLLMPEVDGYQLLFRMRQNPLLASVTVIICTGSSDRGSLTKAVQLGARHFLVKPCTPEVVQAKLNQIRPPDLVVERSIVATG
jgi:two-component system chemotaxis response regulator CheY